MKSLAMASRIAAVLGLLAVAACSSQSYREGISVICDAPSAIVSTGAGEIAEAAKEMADHIEAKLRNREAIEIFSASAESIDVLEEEAKKAGLERCLYVEWKKANVPEMDSPPEF